MVTPVVPMLKPSVPLVKPAVPLVKTDGTKVPVKHFLLPCMMDWGGYLVQLVEDLLYTPKTAAGNTRNMPDSAGDMGHSTTVDAVQPSRFCLLSKIKSAHRQMPPIKEHPPPETPPLPPLNISPPSHPTYRALTPSSASRSPVCDKTVTQSPVCDNTAENQ